MMERYRYPKRQSNLDSLLTNGYLAALDNDVVYYYEGFYIVSREVDPNSVGHWGFRLKIDMSRLSDYDYSKIKDTEWEERFEKWQGSRSRGIYVDSLKNSYGGFGKIIPCFVEGGIVVALREARRLINSYRKIYPFKGE